MCVEELVESTCHFLTAVLCPVWMPGITPSRKVLPQILLWWAGAEVSWKTERTDVIVRYVTKMVFGDNSDRARNLVHPQKG